MARILKITLAATLVGIIVGQASATLSNEDPADRLPTSTAASRGGFEPTVLRAELLPAVTPSGIRRRRARLTVSVRLRNTSERRNSAAAPLLIVDSGRVKPDPATTALAGALLEPVPARTAVRGVLRFETAGEVTEELIKERRAVLRLAGVRVSFEVAAP